jgi:putative phosphoesterase
MRVGLIADLHGNPVALDAVLAALDQEAIDQLVCLGDVAVFGPDPRGVIQRVRQLDCPVVMGNTDAWALDPAPHLVRDADSHRVNDIELWGAAQLDDEERAFLRSFQPTVELELGGGRRLLCYHGSPRSFHEGIFATTLDDQLAAAFEGCTATILAGGHTHAQMVRRYGDKLIVNPGSVGQPIEQVGAGVRYPPWAEYAIVELLEGGEGLEALAVELHRTPVDGGAIINLAYASGMPHADWWAGRWGSAE